MPSNPDPVPRAARPLGLLLACLAAAATHASEAPVAAPPADPNGDLRSIGIAAQGDARHNRTLQGTLTLPVGRRQWLQLSGGQTRVAQEAVAHRAAVFGVGAGHLGDGWQLSAGATHRRDGQRYRQTDGVLALEWRFAHADIGLDGSYRVARQQGTVAAPDGAGGTAWVPVEQRVEGAGVGLRGGLLLGEKTRLFAGAMRHDLRSQTRQNGSVVGAGGGDPAGIAGALLGNRSLLGQALSTRASLVARDELALTRTLRAGLSHRFERVALSAEALEDEVLDTPGTLRTVQLKAAVDLAPGWTLAPAVGRTRSTSHGGVNFGALSLTHAW
jgi:hypothetical protein